MSISGWFKDRVTVSLSSFFDDEGSGQSKTTAAYDAAIKKYNSIYDGFLGDDGQPGDVMMVFVVIKEESAKLQELERWNILEMYYGTQLSD